MRRTTLWNTIAGVVVIATQAFTGPPALAGAAAANPSQLSDQPRANIPDAPVWLGSVRLPRAVLADGQRLPAGGYRVRLTGEYAKDDAAGQTRSLERWVEFVQGSEVKGRAMAPVVPASSIRAVAERGLPAPGTVRVERLKEDGYYRLWFNYRGDHVLVYLPAA